MFQINDYVVYGNHGVCKVLEIGTPDIDGIDRIKSYYTLQPVYFSRSKLYIPVESKKTNLRKLITKEEALKLIDEIPKIDILRTLNDKQREEKYKEAMRKYDCREWIRIIKTLYLRNQQKSNEGKKMSGHEIKYLHEAEDFLYGELSIPLEIPKESMEEFITTRVNEGKKGECGEYECINK